MRRLLLILSLTLLSASFAGAANWPNWRGPTGTGFTSEADFPDRWSSTDGIRWRLKLPSAGNSTPIVWGDRVFLTQSIDLEGTRRAVLCVDRKSGKLLWQQETPFAGAEATHKDNPFCSASPVTDGTRVIAWHGSAGVVCYDFQGKLLWRRDLGEFQHIWGNASSPILYRDTVILNCGPGERQFLVALDRRTGKEVWRVDEPGGRFGKNNAEWLGSWSTPTLLRVGDRDELLVSWPDTLKAYNPENGKLLWHCAGLTKLVYTSVVATPEVAVAMSGYGGAAIAVRPGGSGDATPRRLWREEQNRQRIGSGVIVGEHFYLVNEPGTFQCIELKTGKTVFDERLGGATWASLVGAGDRLYATSMRGETFILGAKPEFTLIARCALEERTLATPALANGEIFIRTHANLYCIAGVPKR